MNFFKRIRDNFVFVWLTIMFIGTTIPGDKLYQPDIFFFDKIEHFVAFSVLSFLFFDRYVRVKQYEFGKSVLGIVLFFTLIYAGFDEFHQQFIPGRFCDYKDFIADSIGVFIGAFIYFIVYAIGITKKIKSIK